MVDLPAQIVRHHRWLRLERGDDTDPLAAPLQRLDQTAEMFGYRVIPLANGAIMPNWAAQPMPNYTPTPSWAVPTGRGTSGAPTIAPTFNAYGPDAAEVSNRLMSQWRHEARSLAVTLPGG